MTQTDTIPPPRRPRRWWLLGMTFVLGALSWGGWQVWTWRETEAAMTGCQQAIEAGRWEDARRLADLWTTRRPTDGAGWLARAEAARHQEDWEATEESLGRIPVTDRRYFRAQALRGDLALEALDDPDRAIAVWRGVLDRAPGAERAHQRLIYLYAMTLQRSRMIQQIRDAIARRSEPPEAYGYLLVADALTFSDGFVRVSKWLKKHPETESLRVAQALFAARTDSKSLALFQADLPPAQDLLSRCEADFPQNLELLAFSLEKLISDGRMDEAGRRIEQLPPVADHEGRFWRYRGAWYDSRNQPEMAEAAYRRALELQPLDWRSHHELANVSRLLRKPREAAFHAELGQRGKQLEREILELPNAAQAGEPLMRRLLDYAHDCGDQAVTEGLKFRLAE